MTEYEYHLEFLSDPPDGWSPRSYKFYDPLHVGDNVEFEEGENYTVVAIIHMRAVKNREPSRTTIVRLR